MSSSGLKFHVTYVQQRVIIYLLGECKTGDIVLRGEGGENELRRSTREKLKT